MIATSTRLLRYALVLGQGRSGTNYLLRLLDQNPATHCRNEADQLEASALGRLLRWRFFVGDPSELEPHWDQAVYDAALTVSARDQRVEGPKDWIFPGTRRPGYFWIRQHYRVVHRMGRRGLPMYGREIRFPRWMTSVERLERAYHVFKLNGACGLAGWMLRNRPEGKAIHIVRHPGGFTKSWLKRWVAKNDVAETERGAKSRLADLAAFDPEWRRRLGDIDAMDVVEAELWFWRYANETIHAAGSGKRSYKLVLYEDLTDAPAEVARSVSEFCGLEWDDQLALRARGISKDSKRIAAAWKTELDPGIVETIERVVDGSPMTSWWTS